MDDTQSRTTADPMTPRLDEGARFTLVIPCYNEEGAIRETIESLQTQLAGIEGLVLVVVNDGSTDQSGPVLRELERDHVNLRVMDHSVNRGYGAALKTGIGSATTPWVGITDADGTYPNEQIAGMLELAEAHGYDMVVGARTLKDEVTYPLIRKIPKVFLARWASWLSRTKIPDINSGMRVFKRESVKRFFRVLPDSFSFTTTITIAMLTNRLAVKYVPIGYSARIGQSKIKPIRDTLRFIQLITRTGMYFAPLRVLWPVILVLTAMFLVSLGLDIFRYHDLTDKTLMLLISVMNTAMFALLADMIDRRSSE